MSSSVPVRVDFSSVTVCLLIDKFLFIRLIGFGGLWLFNLWLFIEALQVEKDIASIASSQGNEENKPSSSEKITKKKGIFKTNTEKKDKDPTDMANMQRVLKQITNELIDLKKSKGEGKNPFKPFMKKRTSNPSHIRH